MFVKNVLFIVVSVFIFPSFLLLLLGIPFYDSTSVTTSDLVTTTNLVLYANFSKQYRNETTISIERLYESKPTTSISTERPNSNFSKEYRNDTTTSLERLYESKPTTSISTQKPNPEDPWKVWSELAKPTVLYPSNGLHSPYMDNILHALATYRVTKFDVGHGGSQLKATMYLHGNQHTVFKPMRLESTIAIIVLTINYRAILHE